MLADRSSWRSAGSAATAGGSVNRELLSRLRCSCSRQAVMAMEMSSQVRLGEDWWVLLHAHRACACRHAVQRSAGHAHLQQTTRPPPTHQAAEAAELGWQARRSRCAAAGHAALDDLQAPQAAELAHCLWQRTARQAAARQPELLQRGQAGGAVRCGDSQRCRPLQIQV